MTYMPKSYEDFPYTCSGRSILSQAIEVTAKSLSYAGNCLSAGPMKERNLSVQ